jgi:hypothetical protein
MQIKKLIILTIALCAVLAVAAFGSNGIKNLFTTIVKPAQAAGDPARQPGMVTVASGAIVSSAVPPGMLTLTNDSDGLASQTLTAVEFVPAPELPARAPDAGGFFSGKEGNTLTLQSFMTFSTTTEGGTLTGGAVMGIAPAGAVRAGTLVISSDSTRAIAAGGQGEAAQAVPAPELAPGDIQGKTIILQGSGQISSGTIQLAPGEAGTSIVVDGGMPASTAPLKVVVTDDTKIYHDVTPMGDLMTAGGTQKIQQVLEAGSLDGVTEQTSVTVWGHMDGEQLVADVILYQNPILMK